MENPHLRKCMGMEDHQKGVLIGRTDPTALAAHKLLKPSDVILSFDRVSIGNDGTATTPTPDTSEASTTDTSESELSSMMLEIMFHGFRWRSNRWTSFQTF